VRKRRDAAQRSDTPRAFGPTALAYTMPLGKVRR
jgi:hypothetical protein